MRGLSEFGEGVACLGYSVGGDERVAHRGQTLDRGEAGAGPLGIGPGFELVERDLGVVADIEDRERAVEEEAEEE